MSLYNGQTFNLKRHMEDKRNQSDINTSTQRPIRHDPKMSHEAIFMTLSKRAEKIASAIYMVTDLVKENDPLKSRLRECAIELISDTRSMSYAFSGDIYFLIAKTINKSWEIVSLIEVSSSVGFISDMNASILKNVLIDLISSMRDKQRRESFESISDMKIGESFSSQISLTKDLFEVEDEDIYKGQNIKDNTSNKMSLIPNPKNDKHSNPRKVKNKNSYSLNNNIGKQKTERRDEIISLIRDMGEVSIKDISIKFPDLSSKTIQRELASLVDQDILLKTGEKRWSKYSIK